MIKIFHYIGLICISVALSKMGYDLKNPIWWLFIIGLILYVPFAGGEK